MAWEFSKESRRDESDFSLKMSHLIGKFGPRVEGRSKRERVQLSKLLASNQNDSFIRTFVVFPKPCDYLLNQTGFTSNSRIGEHFAYQLIWQLFTTYSGIVIAACLTRLKRWNFLRFFPSFISFAMVTGCISMCHSSPNSPIER